VGPIETEKWLPGEVISKNKITTNHLHLTTTNYWAPLNDEEDDINDDEHINIITKKQTITTTKGNKWTRRIERKRMMKLVIDSGATSNFVPEEMNLPKMKKSTKEVFLPDNTKLKATYQTELPLHQLSERARTADILPGLKTPLVSVNKIANEGYTTIFHPGEQGVTIHKPDTVTITTTEPPVLQGCKAKGETLWTVLPDAHTTKEQVNKVYDLPSISQTVKYLHAAAGFPTEDTWIKAIKAGNYSTWPTINPTVVRRHFPESDETQKGHMKRQRQGVRSTRVNQEKETHVPAIPKAKDIYIKIFNSSETMHTDQTGRFPATSSRGNQYIMVLVEVDGNFIDAEPMKNRSEGEMIKAYTALWTRLTKSGTIKPKTHILDNEASAEFKKEIQKNCAIQLVPPDNHRRNLAERAIQTFKSHFKSILAGVDDTFPMRLWDRLLPQTVLTLNLLRQSNAVPTISAWQYVHGHFDYNKMPLAPMGCAVQLFQNSERRTSWGANAIDGWYLLTSPEHYRCHIIYVKQTKSERVSDTVFFKTKFLTQPTLTPADIITKALNDLTQALKGKNNQQGLDQIEALTKLNDILNNVPEPEPTQEINVPEPEPTQEIMTPVEPPRVILDETTKPSQIEATTIDTPLSRVRELMERSRLEPMHKVRIEKIIPNKPNPRVKKLQSNEKDDDNRERIKQYLTTRSMARIPQRNAHLRRSIRRVERAQLIYDEESNSFLKYRQLLRHPKHSKTWAISSANEFGRLANGLKDGRVTPTNTIRFIRKEDVPTDRKKDVTYGSFTCDLRPNKAEVHRTRLTMGGDRINYPDDCGTPTADMTLFKILVNSILSTPNARCLMMDIKDFYLKTPMTRPEYMRLKLSDIPDEVIEHYNLRTLATVDDYVYCEVTKGMYGLPQAGLIAQELLAKRLGVHGYYQSKIIPGLWKHKNRPIIFCLVVDDFAVKYVNRADAEHLINAIKKDYQMTVDEEAKKYIGLTIQWDWTNRKAHIHMPGYLENAFVKFNHDKPMKIQNAPYPHVPPNYGAKTQYIEDEIESPPLSKEDTKYIQAVTGTLLYNARAVDPTILPALSAIATEQAKPTQTTMKNVRQLLDYCSTQEEAIITYNASKMILAVHSDAGYANEKKSRSRAGGHFFLSNDDKFPPNNGAILTVATIIKAVMSSAAEAELGALFINAKEAVYLRQILEEMGHPQPRTPIQTDNTTAEGVINKTIQPKRTKAMDMRFHWLRDREAQGQFKIYWRPGGTNLADYFTKHHAPAHHVNIRAEFLTKIKDLAEARQTKRGSSNKIATLQGCVRQARGGRLAQRILARRENLNSLSEGF